MDQPPEFAFAHPIEVRDFERQETLAHLWAGEQCERRRLGNPAQIEYRMVTASDLPADDLRDLGADVADGTLLVVRVVLASAEEGQAPSGEA